MFTNEDSKRQDAEFAQLKEEFSRLEQAEKQMRKDLNMPENGSVDVSENELTPELRQVLEEAKNKAKRDGEARRTQFQMNSSTGANSGASRPGGRRQNAMRI